MATITNAQVKALLGDKPKGPDSNVSLDEIESFGDSTSLTGMLKSIHSYNTMLNERITLVNDALSAAIPFTKENLYLFCAYTGSGKSTVAANISHPLWKQGKKILVITNEESQQDVIFRIACIELGYSFNSYKKGNMSIQHQMDVVSLFPLITQYVKVLDVVYKDGLTTRVEGIKKALEAVKKDTSYSCVMIDYFQLVKYSYTDPKKTAYENLNDLRIWLGQYIKASTMPVVLFAQLYSVSKKGGAKDIDSRLKDCTSIVEPSTVIVEIIPNYENETTTFHIHKDRFGVAGNNIVCGFENGRYTSLSDNEVAQRTLSGKLKIQSDKLDKLEAAVKVDV
jgi:replicative DNA helicase